MYHIIRNVNHGGLGAGKRPSSRLDRGVKGRGEMPRKAKQQPGIQSVEVAARILRALIDAGRPVPLKELARLARMHPGKAHRYLVSLTRTEIVTQDESSGHYGVGPMAIA